MSFIIIIVTNKTYKNLGMENFLSKYSIYPTLNDATKKNSLYKNREAILWLLNYSDGHNDLITISQISGLSYDILAADLLMNKNY